MQGGNLRGRTGHRGTGATRRRVRWALVLACTAWSGSAGVAAADDAADGGAQAMATADDLPQPDGKSIFGCQAAAGTGAGPAAGLALLGWLAARRWRPHR